MKLPIPFFAVFISFAVCFFQTACDSILNEMKDYDEILNLDESHETVELSVSQLVERMQEATDPKGVWRNCKGYYMRQSAWTEEKKGRSRVEEYWVQEIRFRQPGQVRQTFSRENAVFKTMLLTDGRVWNIDHDNQFSEVTGSEGTRLYKRMVGFSNPKETELSLFAKVELGVIYEDGKRYYRMICRAEDDSIPPYVKYIDPDTFLVKRVETIVAGGDGLSCLYKAESKEYKWIHDIKIATKTSVTIGNERSEDYIIEDFKIDPAFASDTFTLPAASQIDYTKSK